MIRKIILYLKGYLFIRVEGYSPERFLNACSYKGVELWGLTSAGGAYNMYVTLGDFRKSKDVLKKTGTRVRILKRYGLPFFLHRYRKRKLFFAGAVMGCFLVYFLSLFIWEIDIQGNEKRTDETLLSYLKTTDVYCGMSTAHVDCEKIAQDIRKQFQDIVWVSASLKGTRLVIRIKENELEESRTEESREGTDLVADRDCMIVSMVTRQGVPVAAGGLQVKKGDLLVSGRVEIKNDAGEVTGYRYCNAQADIVGQYSVDYEDEIQREYEIHVYQTEKGKPVKQEELFLRVEGRTFFIGRLKNSYPKYEFYTWESQLRIGTGFQFPVFWGKRTVIPYEAKTAAYSDRQLRILLTERFYKSCSDMEKKGLEIIENDVKIYTEKNAAAAKGVITVKGPVTSEQPTEVLPLPDTAGLTERESKNGDE